METVLKSYNVFIDSTQGTKRINLFEQAPNGGAVRVSLKQFQSLRTFGNVDKEYLQFWVKIDNESLPQIQIDNQAYIDGMTEIILPDVYYADPGELFKAKVERIKSFIEASYPSNALVAYETYIDSNGNDRVRWTISGDYIVDRKSLYLKDTGVPSMEFSTAITARDQFIVHEWFAKYFYLRVDGATNNLESKELSTANVDPNDDELIQSDVLAAIPFAGGINPFSYQARVKNESSFANRTGVQSLELRLTDHRNEPIQNISALTVSWSAVLHIELVVDHSVPTLGYGPSPNPVDPKLSGNVYRPI